MMDAKLEMCNTCCTYSSDINEDGVCYNCTKTNIGEDIKEIILNHYTSILSELEEFVNTDDIDLSIRISSDRYGFGCEMN